MAPICIVCAAEKPNYKCPKCLQRYCSLECCKTHKEECILSHTTLSSSSAAISTTDIPAVESGAEAETGATNTVPTVKELIGVELLSEQEKDRLKMSLWLQDILKSNRLRSQITEIDKSPEPLMALRELRKNSEFNEFVHMMLEVLECDVINDKNNRTIIENTKKRKTVELSR